ncbi:MAG TPA: NAD(P)-dependent oxidoreductase [Ktedonobacterales bacterium]|nr:NAD(P)-dependent oxidoreductase [Ktedonobacterales bacterium]
MRLLVTGAGGFLGRNILLALPPSWQVFALHRPGDAAFPAFVSANHLDHIQPVACDLTDAAQVAQAVDQTGRAFESCLYLASNTSIPGSIQRPLDDLSSNVVGLLRALEGWSFDHLVYLSSGAVYMSQTGPVGPSTRTTPTLPYAVSKLAAEHYIHTFTAHRQTPRRATIIRFFGAFGPHEPPRKLYTRLVQRFAFERNPQFCVLGDGDNYIDAMYIDDAVRSLLAALNAPAAGLCVVDLGMGNRESVNKVVRRAARAFGLEARITHEGTAPEYITFHCDPEPFRARYQVAPVVSLEDGLKRLAAHLQQEAQHAES